MSDDGKKPEPDRDLVFYYNRERRLERSSPAVRALNSPEPMAKGGFIRSLTSTKSNLLLLISILIIMAFIMVYSAILGGDVRGTLRSRKGPLITMGGNTLRISAEREGMGSEGESFVVINKRIAPKEDAPYIGEVLVAVSPVLRQAETRAPSNIPVFTDRLFFTLEQEEEYRLALPFTAENYLLLFQVGEERVTARVKTLSGKTIP
ncbi:hypothetical protein AGMMS49944_03520 [Spirochaetia bacterium]|nr:hypothetical protein AGMMS49944_03520 [Spirochaetia bacterium]